MDRQKTGALIAAARREKGLTQKQLGELLHVSDRAVSKWERGAGFPDVALLEPLAAALELEVLELLRGERGAEPDAAHASAETLGAVREIQRQQRRRDRWRDRVCLALWLALLLGLLGVSGLVFRPVDKAVPAWVYRDGAPVEATLVRWKGVLRWRPPFLWEYRGQVQIPQSPVSLGPEHKPMLTIPLMPDGNTWVRHESWTGNVHHEDGPFIGDQFCLDRRLEEFAFSLTDGSVVASSPELYARFQALPPLGERSSYRQRS